MYWAEREDESGPLRFRQYLDVAPGEKILLVDDILRSGKQLSELKRLVEGRGAQVMALAVLVYQPTPKTIDFSPLPLYYLCKLGGIYYKDANSCEMCKRGAAIEKVWI